MPDADADFARKASRPATIVAEAVTLYEKRARGRLSLRLGPVAQWLEPAAHNGLVGGSNPPGPTRQSEACGDFPEGRE